MSLILGIDPGSQITGFGLVEMNGNRSRYVDSGCIRTASGQAMAERLKTIFEGVDHLIDRHNPNEMAIEQVFMHRNPDSALKLGQARGAAICAGAVRDIPISEYAARSIKQAVVGKGNASKEQVQHMVCALLGLSKSPQSDAADALAVALCHGHTAATNQRLQQAAAGGRRR